MLFVINSLAGGGAERVFATILDGSRGRLADYDIRVALLDRDPPAFALPEAVRIYQLDCGHSLALSVFRLIKLVREVRPALTVSFLTRANVAATAAMRVVRGPAIVSERNDTTAQLGYGRFPALARSVVRLSYSGAARVIAVSAGLNTALQKEYAVKAERVRVIANPIDASAIRTAAAADPPFPVEPTDVVMLARLEPQKNLKVAIGAFAMSERRGRLLILGDGSLKPQLRALGDRLGLGDRLVMPGYVANPHSVLGRAAMFMLSSRHEGFCNALVEAMALGLPVLAADCRFSPAEILQVARSPQPGEVVVGSGGLLVAVDDTDGLAQGLRMLENRVLAAQLGQQGRLRAEDFGRDRQIDRYWDVIAEVLAHG